MPASTNRPDFVACRGDVKLYVEAAVTFSGIVKEDGRDSEREAWICDITNKVSNPNFHVGLEIERAGSQAPRHQEIIPPLKEWLNGLDPDIVSSELESGSEPPEIRLRPRDWELVYSAFPITVEYRGKPGRLLGIGPSEGEL